MNTITQEYVHLVGHTYINPIEVIKLVASVNYTTIYLANGKHYVVAQTINKVYQALLPYGQFIRTHKSYVINLAYVLQQTPTGFLMQNNEMIDCARRRKKQVKKQLREFAR